MNKPHSQTGMTLAELLITLAVAAILVVGSTTALPRFIQEGRMVTEVNHFTTALALARSTAIMQDHRVVLCPSRDRSSCGSSQDWTSGWLLFASDDRKRDPDEPVLQAGELMGTGITLHAGNQRRHIVYQPDGSSGGTNASFTFCDRRHHARPRVICLSNTGRSRLSRRTCGGQPVRCP
ncbi:MAG: GspH/FimT family pseudopilin [Gammaproteobacteria bacterium]